MHLELLFSMLSSGFKVGRAGFEWACLPWVLLLPLCQVCSRSECRFGYKVVMFLSGCFMCPRVELAVNGVLGI